jgi:hypothetical protein
LDRRVHWQQLDSTTFNVYHERIVRLFVISVPDDLSAGAIGEEK